MPIGPGDHVTRYVVESELGRGGMGVVFTAFDPSLHRKIALKVLRPDADDPNATERMMREARAMAQLAHPNVVGIHDVGTLPDGEIFLAMELVLGGSLRAAFREGWSSERLVALLEDAGRGLLAAHDVGLIHRDFKPDNVLVGTDGRARVTDFGLARPSVTGTLRSLTEAGSILGTPGYMSPEQHVGAPATPQVDQYAFGIALFDALVGVRPFRGSYEEIVAKKIARAPELNWPTTRPIPVHLKFVVQRALAREPEDRFPSMRELLAAMKAPIVVAAPPPPPPPPRPAPPPPAPTSGFHPALIVVVTIGTVGLFIVITLGLYVRWMVQASRTAVATAPAAPTIGANGASMAPPAPTVQPYALSASLQTSVLPCPRDLHTVRRLDTFVLECIDPEGRSEGPRLVFYPTGILASQSYIVRGQPQGKTYTFDEAGRLATVVEYSSGVRNGAVYTMYPSGHVHTYGVYARGAPAAGPFEYREDGQMILDH